MGTEFSACKAGIDRMVVTPLKGEKILQTQNNSVTLKCVTESETDGVTAAVVTDNAL